MNDKSQAGYTSGIRKNTNLNNILAKLLLLVCAVWLHFNSHAQVLQNQYAIGPVPQWSLQNIPIPPHKATNAPPQSQGIQFDVMDNQIHALREEQYTRMRRTILNESGLQNGSLINISFDPSYQKLTIHFIQLIRDGETLNRLNPAQLRVLQQEQNLERHIYDGRSSVVAFLEDVRVGDQIDYAFTLAGRNPVLNQRFVHQTLFEWQVPVSFQRLRLIWPTGKYLNVSNLNGAPRPSISNNNDTIEYLWEDHEQSGLLFEDSIPPWYNPLKWIQISDFQDWSEVVDWALKFYPTTQSLSPELQQKIDSWRQKGLPDSELFLEVLRFTQDEVRYLGIEFGPNSHRPSKPSTVFERRFGDCKDKTLLLCTILNDLGIEAVPALVNTEYRHTITQWHASPYAFNHVIARVKVGQEFHYVDPTTSSQRGPLLDRYRPDYGYCLLIAPGNRELTQILAAKTGLPKTTHDEVFNVPSAKDSKVPVTLSVTTTMQGLSADGLRRILGQSSKEQLGKTYLNYYARIYPDISPLKPMEISDDVQKNIITLREFYYIHNFWKKDESKKIRLCEFYPQTIRDVLQKPITTLRKMPLYVNSPVHVVQTTKINLPTHFLVKNESQSIRSVAARFDFSAKYDQQKTNITLRYEYKTVGDFVSVNEVPAYLRKLDDMLATLGYQISQKEEPPNKFGRSSDDPSSINNYPVWFVGTFPVYFLSLIVGAILLYRFLTAKRQPVPPPLPTDIHGIRGWLLFVAFIIIINPLRLTSELWPNLLLFGQDSWYQIATPGQDLYHEGLATLLIYEVFFQSLLLIYSLLLAGLFFTKQRHFPRMMILFIGSNFIFSLIDYTLARQIPFFSENQTSHMLSRLMGGCVGLIAWSSYFTKSVRVKNTFIR